VAANRCAAGGALDMGALLAAMAVAVVVVVVDDGVMET
jgi:hypothetical protein